MQCQDLRRCLVIVMHVHPSYSFLSFISWHESTTNRPIVNFHASSKNSSPSDSRRIGRAKSAEPTGVSLSGARRDKFIVTLLSSTTPRDLPHRAHRLPTRRRRAPKQVDSLPPRPRVEHSRSRQRQMRRWTMDKGILFCCSRSSSWLLVALMLTVSC